MGSLFAEGMEMLFDGQQRYLRDGLQCFLRGQNFPSEGDFQEFGVPYAPSGTAAAETGFTDILIDPPPSVTAVSTHDIGVSGGKLMFGARKFLISDTFVSRMLQQYPGIVDPYDVFRNWDGTTPVVGIIYDNRMFSIEQIIPREIGGRRISWTVTCNYNESYLIGEAAEKNVP